MISQELIERLAEMTTIYQRDARATATS
jgi:hypothetical protein